MRFLDCLDNNIFDNYWYWDGISDKLGYSRFKQINVQGSVVEVEKSLPSPLTLSKVIVTFAKFLSLLTLLIPAGMLAGKFAFRLNHIFTLSEKPLAIHERISVGTYNILYPQKLVDEVPPEDSINVGYRKDNDGKLYENSDFRLGVIAENILRANLDVICVQEATDAMCDKLQTSLKDQYVFKWVKHHNFDGVGFLYKKNKFKLLNEKSESVTVQIEGEANPGACQDSPPRSHLLVDLMDKTTQKVYRITSCDLFDPRYLQDKEEHTKKVVDFAENQPHSYFIDRTIIAGTMNQDQFGDMRSTPGGAQASEMLAASFQPFIDNEYHVDGNFDSSEYMKKKPGNGKMHSKNRRIDWIWVKKSRPEHYPLPDVDVRGSNHSLVASLIC